MQVRTYVPTNQTNMIWVRYFPKTQVTYFFLPRGKLIKGFGEEPTKILIQHVTRIGSWTHPSFGNQNKQIETQSSDGFVVLHDGVNRGARNERAMDKLLVLMLLILVEIDVCMYDVR